MRRLAVWQGAYWLLSGIWPLLHYRSFERVTGRKTDDWLVRVVGSLVSAVGLTLLLSRRPTRELGVGAAVGAAGLGSIGLWESVRGRISPIYALDGVGELAIAAVWSGLLLRGARGADDEQEGGRLL